MTYKMQILLLAVCVCVTLAQNTEDPMCVEKGCPYGKSCRVVTKCSYGVCSLEALCMDTPPKSDHACMVGKPILIMRDGAWGDTYCGPSLRCPYSTYCNADLMDTYPTCCRSDPANKVKPGDCPATTNYDTSYCIDRCGNDGDCNFDYKCCQDGCRRSCLPPQRGNTYQ